MTEHPADALSMEEPGHISRDLRGLADEIGAGKGLVIEAAAMIDAQARALHVIHARALELQALLKNCADRLESCCRRAGNDPEVAASAVSKYRAALTTGGGDVE